MSYSSPTFLPVSTFNSSTAESMKSQRKVSFSASSYLPSPALSYVFDVQIEHCVRFHVRWP